MHHSFCIHCALILLKSCLHLKTFLFNFFILCHFILLCLSCCVVAASRAGHTSMSIIGTKRTSLHKLSSHFLNIRRAGYMVFMSYRNLFIITSPAETLSWLQTVASVACHAAPASERRASHFHWLDLSPFYLAAAVEEVSLNHQRALSLKD